MNNNMGGGTDGAIRMVMHKDIGDEGLELLLNELQAFFEKRA